MTDTDHELRLRLAEARRARCAMRDAERQRASEWRAMQDAADRDDHDEPKHPWRQRDPNWLRSK
jgi:hypothetical protein